MSGHDDGEDYYDRADAGDDDYRVVDAFRAFVVGLNRRLESKDVGEIAGLYEGDLEDLTERYYKASSWPAPRHIAPLVDESSTFMSLYKQLFYRHVFVKLQPSMKDRIDSYNNYLEIFDLLLGIETPNPEIELPTQWVWDILDECIYQFQSFHQLRHAVNELKADEIEILKAQPDIWSAHSVLSNLHALARKAGLDVRKPFVYKDESEGAAEAEKAEENTNVHPFVKAVGSLALVAALRVNTLVGDYAGALSALNPLDLRAKGNVFSTVPLCNTSLYYHLSFSLLMLRRYTYATRALSNFLLYVTRNKSSVARAYQSPVISKTVERMFSLLSIANALVPQRLEETLQTALKERYQDKLQRLQQGEVAAFQDMFSSCSPHFITLAPPNYNNVDPQNDNASDNAEPEDEMYNLQLKLFLQEVQQRSKLPEIYSYLRMCTSVDIAKLVSFLGSDEDAVVTWLLCLKHKGRNLPVEGGSASLGHFAASAEVDFSISKDVVHIKENKAPRRYGEYFIRNILKFEDLIEDINATKS